MVRFFTICFFIGLSFKVSGQEVPLTPGKVWDTVRCRTNTNQSYALYLPKAYNTNTTWPVIFFYDPAARGSVPVNMYSSLAEKYQCILVGSNNSRNGPFNVTQDSEQAMLKDVTSRFSIATNRLFISGFSGGARASVFLSMQRKAYAGIIACGAAFPYGDKLKANDNIPFIEVIGNLDFNFMESIEVDDYLNKINYPHSLIFFNGPHTWPPVAVYDQAIFWQLFRLQPPRKSEVESYEKGLLEKVNLEISTGELSMAAWSLNHFVLSTFKIDSVRKKVFADPFLDKQRKKFYALLETEKDLLREFYKLYEKVNYATHDSTFKESEWRGLFAKVKKFAKSEDILEKQMYERVLAQVRVSCIEDYRGHIEVKRYLQASLMVRGLILLQPDYQYYVLLARAYAKMDRKRDAVAALSKSAELGLSDRTILDHTDFSSLVKEKKFNAVKERVELNTKKTSQ